MVNIFDMEWYRDINNSTSPGEMLRIYRENAGFTQEAKKMGQSVLRLSACDMTGLWTGLDLSLPVERFLYGVDIRWEK